MSHCTMSPENYNPDTINHICDVLTESKISCFSSIRIDGMFIGLLSSIDEHASELIRDGHVYIVQSQAQEIIGYIKETILIGRTVYIDVSGCFQKILTSLYDTRKKKYDIENKIESLKQELSELEHEEKIIHCKLNDLNKNLDDIITWVYKECDISNINTPPAYLNVL